MESLWERNYGRRGLELSEGPSTTTQHQGQGAHLLDRQFTSQSKTAFAHKGQRPAPPRLKEVSPMLPFHIIKLTDDGLFFFILLLLLSVERSSSASFSLSLSFPPSLPPPPSLCPCVCLSVLCLSVCLSVGLTLSLSFPLSPPPSPCLSPPPLRPPTGDRWCEILGTEPESSVSSEMTPHVPARSSWSNRVT